MSETQKSILAANQEYARKFSNREPAPAKPAKRAALLTCMDHRIDPAEFAGIKEGDAHVIRNAGGRASEDAIRSLVISHKCMGTAEWFVVQHTGCAMCTFSNQDMGDLLLESLDPAEYVEGTWRNLRKGQGSSEGYKVEWLTIDEIYDSVRTDVMRIADHPLVSKKISIFGYVFDTSNGCVKEVEGATRHGKPVEK